MSLTSPLVSIIVPVFNRGTIIMETLNSVKNQTYLNWECIVVDDFSTDNTYENIQHQVEGDDRFILINNQRKKGAPGARNTGIENSKGDFVIFLDSDDLLSPGCISGRIDKFNQNPGLDFLVFSTIEFKKKIDDTNILLNVFTKGNVMERFLNLDVPWLSTGPIWKRTSLLNLGKWNEGLVGWQDWEYHLRALFNNYKFKYYSIIDNYWRTDFSLESIGRSSVDKDHLRSHLELLGQLKLLMTGHANYICRLNGIAYWIAERALEKGFLEIAKAALIVSHDNLNPVKRVINLLGLRSLKKFYIKHPNTPDFGIMRTVYANQ